MFSSLFILSHTFHSFLFFLLKDFSKEKRTTKKNLTFWMQKESSQCKTVGLIARISWSLLHRGDRASTCEKVAIKDGVSKSLETSFLLMALFFFFEQHQYSHPQCKWCLKVLIQTYIDVASVRLTSTQGSGEKLLWPDRRSSAHSWKVWSMFVCLCVWVRERVSENCQCFVHFWEGLWVRNYR